MSTYLSLASGKGFDVEGELSEVAHALQTEEGPEPRLVSFTAEMSSKTFTVMVNPEHVAFLVDGRGTDLRMA